jgi:hypothetical protein
MAWLKRTYKRDWLQRSPWLNSVSYKHELSNNSVWELKPEFIDVHPNKLCWENYYPVEQIQATFELTFSIGSEIITIHSNPNIGPSDALKDYVRKLELMNSMIQRFLSEYKTYFDKSKVFVLKEFLNDSDGVSGVYTSMIAIGTSVTHNFFFEIASCIDKNRLYEEKEKNFIEILIKLNKFIHSAITDAKTAMETYKGKL